MEIREYQNIYTLENTYWWYKVLDSLVENSVKKYFQNRRIKILDAGCGTGRILEKLSSFGETEGIDFSPEAIKYCILRGQRNVKLANINEWKSGTKKYDLIVSLDVLYHKAIENEEKTLKSFNEVLK